MRREAGGERGSVAKFALYLGSEHHQPDACKFLMAALLNSRCGARSDPRQLSRNPPFQCSSFGLLGELAERAARCVAVWAAVAAGPSSA